MDRAVLHFFVVLERLQNRPKVHSFQRRQLADCVDGRFDTLNLRGRHLAKSGANPANSDHAISDGFAMFDPPVPRGSLESMPDRMPEVQNPPKTAFLFVMGY